MGNRRFYVAKVGRNRKQPSTVDDPPSLSPGTIHFERHYAAETLLLRLCQLMTWMGRKTRIIDFFDPCVSAQPLGKRSSIFRMRAHTNWQRLQPFVEYPCVERAHGRSCGAQGTEKRLVNLFVVGHECATDTTALPVKVFGRRVHDYVCPYLQWSLQHRCAIHIVNHQKAIGVVSQLRQRADIADLPKRVRWRLEKQQTGLF